MRRQTPSSNRGDEPSPESRTPEEALSFSQDSSDFAGLHGGNPEALLKQGGAVIMIGAPATKREKLLLYTAGLPFLLASVIWYDARILARRLRSKVEHRLAKGLEE